MFSSISLTFPEASVALLMMELLRTDVSVGFCLSPAKMKSAEPVGIEVAACFGEGMRSVCLLPAFNTAFCSTRVHM